jgi:hypothetical protein
MGDSLAWEAYEQRTEPPTFSELFKGALRSSYRKEALHLVKGLDLVAADEIRIRCELAEAQRAHHAHRFRRARREFERVVRRMHDTEASLTALLDVFHGSPTALLDARDFLRHCQKLEAVYQRAPKGRRPLPYSYKAFADLGLEPSAARILLRGTGSRSHQGAAPTTQRQPTRATRGTDSRGVAN